MTVAAIIVGLVVGLLLVMVACSAAASLDKIAGVLTKWAAEEDR